MLAALSIPQVGEETAHDLAEYFKTVEGIRNASFEELERIRGIGPIVGKSVFDWFSDPNNQRILDALLAQISVASAEKKKDNLPLEGKTFVITGTLATLSREDAEAKIRTLGGHPSGSVSAKTDFVVAGEKAGSKYEKAKTLGVKILSETEFLELFSE